MTKTKMKVQSVLLAFVIICSLCILTLFPILYIIGNIEQKTIDVQAQTFVKIAKISNPWLINYYISVDSFYDQGEKYRWGYIDIFTMYEDDFDKLNQHENFGYIHHKIQVYKEKRLGFYKFEDVYIIVKNDNLLFTTHMRYTVIYIDMFITFTTLGLFVMLLIFNCITYKLLTRKFPNQRLYELTPDIPLNNF